MERRLRREKMRDFFSKRQAVDFELLAGLWCEAGSIHALDVIRAIQHTWGLVAGGQIARRAAHRATVAYGARQLARRGVCLDPDAVGDALNLYLKIGA